MFSLKDHASGTVRVSHDTIADFETGGAQRVGRDGDLMLGTDPCGASATVLYLSHECKGTAPWSLTQAAQGTAYRRVGDERTRRSVFPGDGGIGS